MKSSLRMGVATALLLLSNCAKDLSCYRDMIIGVWVEQTFDGQPVETNLQNVHIFDRSNSRTIRYIADFDGDSRNIVEASFVYFVDCKIITTIGPYSANNVIVTIDREEEVKRFNDTILRVKVVEDRGSNNTFLPDVQEIVYKKTNSKNLNAKAIQNLWEMTHSSDPTVPPFQIRFNSDETYAIFFEKESEGEEDEEEGRWEEKVDERGRYTVYDFFLTITFVNNPIFGLPEKNDVACWEIEITEVEGEKDKEKDTAKEMTMRWSAVRNINGQLVEKSFLFTSVAPPIEEVE